MPRPHKPALTGLTAKQRAVVKELLRELDRARQRDGRSRARFHRAEAAAHHPGRAQQKVDRRLAKVKAALNQNDQKLRKIIGRLNGYGLSLEQIAGGIVIVDDHDDAEAEMRERDRVRDARRDRKDVSERRAKLLPQAFEDEFKKQRQAAKGVRVKVSDVYAAVAEAYGVSTATVRRALSHERNSVKPTYY